MDKCTNTQKNEAIISIMKNCLHHCVELPQQEHANESVSAKATSIILIFWRLSIDFGFFLQLRIEDKCVFSVSFPHTEFLSQNYAHHHPEWIAFSSDFTPSHKSDILCLTRGRNENYQIFFSFQGEYKGVQSKSIYSY